MSGKLTVVGLGPGSAELTTPAVTRALAEATDLVGYVTYVDRVPPGREGQRRHASDNRVEVERAREALALAASGNNVVVVSSGDPGVFAMAAALFEAVETGEPSWRSLDIRIEPGVTAMLAAAAHVGAPLGGDFCTISLSDNLKAWSTIERRLQAAAQGDFVIALYNPASVARPDQLNRAFALLREWKSADTLVIFVRAAGTDYAEKRIVRLGEADAAGVDMRTLVLIGSSRTRALAREGAEAPWIYTPRSERDFP